MLRYWLAIVTCWSCAYLCQGAVAASPSLLRQTVADWLGGRDRWAFTQQVVEHANDGVHERVERYDPSRPENDRWLLLAVDGKRPTPEQRQKWMEKRLKHHPRKIDRQIGDYFDFSAAEIVAETARLVRYQVPIRKDKNWLFPSDKLSVRFTIDKETRALEHMSVHVREPFKVLLGVARVTGGELDLDFLRFDHSAPTPSAAKPTGTAHASMSRLGERMEFTWSEFTRVTPYRDRSATLSDGAGDAMTEAGEP